MLKIWELQIRIYLPIVVRPNQILRPAYSIKKLIQSPLKQIWLHLAHEVLFRSVHFVDVKRRLVIFVLAVPDVLLLKLEIWVMKLLNQLLSIESICHQTQKFMNLQLYSFQYVPCLQLDLAWTPSNRQTIIEDHDARNLEVLEALQTPVSNKPWTHNFVHGPHSLDELFQIKRI